MIKIDGLSRDELIAQAKALKQNPMFNMVLEQMEYDAIQAIRADPIGGLTAQAACATLRTVEEIRSYLEVFITDEKMALRSRYKPVRN